MNLVGKLKDEVEQAKSPEELKQAFLNAGIELSEEELADQGISQNTIRLSIGTEHIDDIIADLEKGFAAIG